MKHLLRGLAVLVLGLLCTPVQAQWSSSTTIYAPWSVTSDPVYGYNAQGLPMAEFLASLTVPLVPAIPSGSFECNSSGSSNQPGACTFGTGLSLSSGVLSATGYTFAIGSPTTRTLAFSTAYQATTSSKPAAVTMNLSSTAGLTLTSGTTNTAIVVIGSTSSVASGTGTTIATYSNSLTGTLVVGLAINTNSVQTVTFLLPAGWYFAVLQQTGTVTVNSVFDQSLG